MLDGCAKGPTFAEASRILELEASTSTLVVMVHFMIFALSCSVAPATRIGPR